MTKFRVKVYLVSAILILCVLYPVLISLLNTKQIVGFPKENGNELEESSKKKNSFEKQTDTSIEYGHLDPAQSARQDQAGSAHGRPPDPIVAAPILPRIYVSNEDNSRNSYGGQNEYAWLPAKKLTIPYRLVHLDLKGAAPSLSYLTNLLSIFHSAGANGILIEYEDMFPFKSTSVLLGNTSNTRAYKESELKTFLETAAKLNFEIIPLVQTFGHLEFLLKLSHLRKFREVDLYPQELCPSNEEADKLISEMLDEIITFHKKVLGNGLSKLKYVHIGCDEVFHLGMCERCRGKSSPDLFLNRVRKVALEVEKKHNLRPIIWDDMLRRISKEDMERSEIGQHADLMVWDYTENVDNLISPYLWPMYASIFPNIWVASAFKGAFGESLYRVESKRHAMNHVSWLQTLARETREIKNFRGFALTGWSRYDHFAVLCELLPAAIPSAVLSLQILEQQNLSAALSSTARILKCSGDAMNLDQFAAFQSYCTFPGSELIVELDNLHFIQKAWERVKGEWGENGKGWLTKWNKKHNSTSFWRLEEVEREAKDLLRRTKNLEMTMRSILLQFYANNPSTVDEWLEQRVYWIQEEINQFLDSIDKLARIKVWDRRG